MQETEWIVAEVPEGVSSGSHGRDDLPFILRTVSYTHLTLPTNREV